MGWITFSFMISSGLLGVIISTVYYHRHEKYLIKLETLKEFAGNRYNIKGDPFSKALNEIYIVFNQSKEVKNALQAFYDNIRGNNPALSNDLLVKLYKAMCSDLHIKTNDFTDEFFLTPFNTKKD